MTYGTGHALEGREPSSRWASRNASSAERPTIWHAVFHLPSELTFTACRAAGRHTVTWIRYLHSKLSKHQQVVSGGALLTPINIMHQPPFVFNITACCNCPCQQATRQADVSHTIALSRLFRHIRTCDKQQGTSRLLIGGMGTTGSRSVDRGLQWG